MKTIQQQIKLNLAKKYFAKSNNPKKDIDRKTDYETGFYDGVEFAQRWISVNEEPCPSNKQILIKTSNGCIYDAMHNSFDNKVVSWWSNSFEIIKTEITHWRHIELE